VKGQNFTPKKHPSPEGAGHATACGAAATGFAKGRLSRSRLPSFTLQKAVFYSAKDGLSQRLLQPSVAQDITGRTASCRAATHGGRTPS